MKRKQAFLLHSARLIVSLWRKTKIISMEQQTKYDVFISYSRKDYVDENKNIIPGNVVSRIKDALTDAGISYWFDEEGINHGDKFAKLIVRNIKASRIFLFVSTENANSSEWTGREIASAHMMKKRIIPVRVDDSTYHEDVMFYISILDYVDYKANPEKGIKDLIKAIKAFLAEEQEAERRQLVAEEERRKQEEGLIRRQRQMESLKAEIKQTENDCTQLEEQMLLKKHEFESVRASLDKKRERLDDQKHQLNAILFDDQKQYNGNVVGSSSDDDLPSELSADIISWRHPIERMKQIWNSIDYIATKRNLLTNFVFELGFIIGVGCFIGGICYFLDVSFESYSAGYSIVITFFSALYTWGIYKILRNERQGFWFCIFTPIISFPVSCIVYWHDGGLLVAFLVFISLLMVSIPVLSMLFLRKNQKTAWILMTGSWKDLLKWRDKIILSACCIILFVASICYCYVQGNKNTIFRESAVEVKVEPEPKPTHPLQNELDSIQILLNEERHYISNIEEMISYKRKKQNDESGNYRYYDAIRVLAKDKDNAVRRVNILISQYNKVYKDTISVAPVPKHTETTRGDGDTAYYFSNNSRETQEIETKRQF